MDILSKPDNIFKGAPALFTIDKTALVSLSPVASDAYFSNTDNWFRIYLMYQSNPGRQKEYVSFDAKQATPAAFFEVSNRARSNFILTDIIIQDFDNATLTISRDDIPDVEAEFDVTVS